MLLLLLHCVFSVLNLLGNDVSTYILFHLCIVSSTYFEFVLPYLLPSLTLASCLLFHKIQGSLAEKNFTALILYTYLIFLFLFLFGMFIACFRPDVAGKVVIV